MDTSTTARSRSRALSPKGDTSSMLRPPSVPVPWQLDPQLRELATERPAQLMQLLEAQGAQTCRDVRTLWSTGGALVEEYEASYGKLSAADAFSLHAFWTTVSGRSGQESARVTAAVVQDRQSTLLIHAAPVHGAEERPKIISYRQMVTTGALPVPPVLAAAAEADPHAREKAAKEHKLDALFQILLEEVLDLAELGISHEEIQDPGVVQQLKETVMAQPGQLSTQRLGALASSFRRWKRYAAPRQIPIRKPTPLQLASFFKEVSRGGPTAAAALWQSLRWFEDKMGLPLGLHHFLVKPYQFLPSDYSAVQAPELQPWEFANLVLFARGQQGTNLMVVQLDKQSLESWLGQPAIDAVDQLLRTGPPRHAAEILQVTQEEQAKGFCSPFLTRCELDDTYGRG
eukprot:s1516_g9.t1